MANISTSFNSLLVEGPFEISDSRRALAAIHSIKKAGYDSLNLDMTQLSYAMPNVMLPFATQCRSMDRSGFRVSLELPEEPKLMRLFENSNWAHIIDEQGFESAPFKTGNHIPALPFATADQHHTTVSTIMDFMLAHIQVDDRKQLQSLEWALNEITDNVLNHAESSIGGFVQANFHPKRNEVEFIVTDAGLTIPKTLRGGNVGLKNDSDPTCLDKAIREGVTKNSTTNQGNGLYGAYRLSQLSRGRFSIHSGYASLNFNDKNGLGIAKQEIPYPGSTVVCTIKLDDANLLGEALTFKGVQYSPSYTIVEKLEEADEVILQLEKECQSFGSRSGAAPVRQKIENILSTTAAPILLNFENVALITSSFADEVVGKIYAKLGPLGFGSRVRVVGANKIVSQLIDRAILQRVAFGKGD